MATCKECFHDNACGDVFRFFGSNADYKNCNVETQCKHFKNKADVIDIPDDTIIYVQDKWLVINTESEDLGKAIKGIVDYCNGERG